MSMFDKRRDSEPEKDTSVSEPPADTRITLPNPVSSPRDIAVIGKTITISGDVTGDESLVIDGKVDGTVRLKSNDLTVGQSGRVTADVTARVVRIEGEVTGDITGIEKVVITKTGRVHGNVVAPRVTLEDGSKFKGSIDMDPGPAQQPAAPKSVPTGKPLSVVDQTGPAADRA